jgi:hypothetical protein
VVIQWLCCVRVPPLSLAHPRGTVRLLAASSAFSPRQLRFSSEPISQIVAVLTATFHIDLVGPEFNSLCRSSFPIFVGHSVAFSFLDQIALPTFGAIGLGANRQRRPPKISTPFPKIFRDVVKRSSAALTLPMHFHGLDVPDCARPSLKHFATLQ